MFLSDDDMVECPYNKTHRMLRKRLQSHLLKCRLNYPDVELRKCPFNITHLIPEPEFTHHATNCPDRKLITQYKYDAPEPKEEDGPKHAPIECDEDWDDTDANDYNPQLYLEKANVIRKPDGANPSERKLFIKKERKRLGDGDDSSEEERRSSNSPSSKKRQRSDGLTDDETSLTSFRPRSLNNKTSQTEASKRSSPSTLFSCSKRLSRSPTNISRRNRSRSPAGLRSYRDRSPPRRKSPNSHYSQAQNSIGGALYSANTNQNPYYKRAGAKLTNDSFNSGRDPYYSNVDDSQAYCDRNLQTNSMKPKTPPPPIISYPAPSSYRTLKPSSSASRK